MARKVKEAIGPFRPVATSFEKGKERPIEFTLFPEYIAIRVVGIKGEYHVNYGTVLRLGIEAEITHRIKRGGLR